MKTIPSLAPNDDPPHLIVWLTNPKFQLGFALFSLVLMLVFTSAFYLYAVDEGLLLYAETGGEIVKILPGGPAERAGLQVGDVILSIEGRPVDPWLRRPLLPAGVKPGDVLAYTVQRDAQVLTVPVQVETFFDDFGDAVAVIGIQVVAAIFWVLGLLLVLFSSPDDLRARLIGISWLLVGVSAAAGGPGILSRFWGAGVGLIVGWSWLTVTLVSAHLYFPAPTFSARTRRSIVFSLAILTSVISILDILDEWVFKSAGWSLAERGLPVDQIGYFFTALGGISCMALLVRHQFAPDLDIRRKSGIVLWGTVLALSPFLVLTLIPLLLWGPDGAFAPGGLTVLFIVILALVYAYVIRQHTLLKVDFLINRLVVYFVLATVLLLTSTLILGIFAAVLHLPAQLPLVGGVFATLVALPSATIHQRVQEQTNRVLYGSHYDFSTVTGTLSSYLARTLDRQKLFQLLTQSLALQMGIQRTALFLNEGGKLVLQGTEEPPFTAELREEMCQFLKEAHLPVPAPHLWRLLPPKTVQAWEPFAWGQLFVPLIFENTFHGLLILGTRTASEVYSTQDLHIITTVAYQAALALENVQLVETLRGHAQTMVRNHEKQRKRFADDLHDAVLQNLYFLKKRLAEIPGVEDLNDLLFEVMKSLREIIHAQRPSTLDQGLAMALEKLTQEAQGITENAPMISWFDESRDDIEVDDETAISIYRIAQEALFNVLKHAQAQFANVILDQHSPTEWSLTIEDDGIGLPVERLTPANGHAGYGLVGMRERALMIGADLEILSDEEGTSVTLRFAT